MSRLSVEIDLFTATGSAAVIAGGLVAAVARPLDLAKGSWLAAYLVLVCGVALIAIGIAQQRAPQPMSARFHAPQLTGWIAANALVIAGSLTDTPAVVDVGSILLLVVLAATWRAGLRLLGSKAPAAYAYLAVLTVLIVSVPIGMVLASR
ncbi:hypothetical protein ACE11G_03220 [Gordonia sp. PS3]|uniref:hypothetical protein n=1 Tax=unclassified Gordonia (in: high G+C Gram-positive bacteria) TaxID=2657482 RepID=UPI000782A54F|nr:hypothetical protein [Gordonia sp. QH-12]KXT58886.1 hypothetical protein Y710_01170 [Gordonia sp. QH-12]